MKDDKKLEETKRLEDEKLDKVNAGTSEGPINPVRNRSIMPPRPREL